MKKFEIEKIVNLPQLEECAKRILKSPRFRRFVITSLALTLILTKNAYAVEGDWNRFGVRFWGYVKVAAKWGCLIMCGISIIRNMETEDVKSVLIKILRYGAIFAAIIILPLIFAEIERMLS